VLDLEQRLQTPNNWHENAAVVLENAPHTRRRKTHSRRQEALDATLVLEDAQNIRRSKVEPPKGGRCTIESKMHATVVWKFFF